MTRIQERKKFNLRKFINHMKNRFQRVRKFCRMHTLPVLVAVGIMVSVIFASYQNAYATGLEEYFYYTYFDLISGLFAETGTHFGLKDDYYTKSDRVSGKQVWDNFCTWVENKAKVAALPVEIVNKTVFDELKNLPNTVTSAGAKMSEKLSELLAKILPTFNNTNGNQFNCSSVESVGNMIHSLTGGYLDDMRLNACVNDGYLLNIVFSEGSYNIFVVNPSEGQVSTCYDSEIDVNRLYITDLSGRIEKFSTGGSIVCNGKTSYDMSIGGFAGDLTWVIKNGAFTGADGTTINDYANVKTLHDGSVWVPGEGFKDSWAVWDAIKDLSLIHI